MNKIVIGALSCNSYIDRRQDCLDTWIPELKALGIDTYFLIGAASAWYTVNDYKIIDHNLYLDCPDNYDALPQKTAAFCRWMLKNDYDYLFKCDDDTYIVPQRFAHYDTAGRDYIGIDPCSHDNPVFGSGGGGYFLSRKAAEIVANQLEKSGPEDLLVGQLLARNGIKFYNDKRFQGWKFPHTIPTKDNDGITVHYIKGQEMHSIHSQFKKS